MLIRYEDKIAKVKARGENLVTAYEAQQLWPYLCGQAVNRRIVKYGEVQSIINRGDFYSAISVVLGHISYYCYFNRIPVLPLIVVNRYGTPGDGFDMVGLVDRDKHRELVFEYPWFNLKVPPVKILKQVYERGVSGERISGKVLTG